MIQEDESGINAARGKRIRKAMGLKGFSQQALADAIGCSQANIGKILNGGPSTYIYKISKILGENIEYLEEGKGQQKNLAMSDLYEKMPEGSIPVIQWTQAAQWGIPEQTPINLDPNAEYIINPHPTQRAKNIYALRVKNDSMVGQNMSFPEGMILVVEPDVNIVHGDYVIAIKDRRLGGTKEAIFRRFMQDGDNELLVPLNKQYETDTVDNYNVLGKVIAWLDFAK